jgi:hypothetical protein
LSNWRRLGELWAVGWAADNIKIFSNSGKFLRIFGNWGRLIELGANCVRSAEISKFGKYSQISNKNSTGGGRKFKKTTQLGGEIKLVGGGEQLGKRRRRSKIQGEFIKLGGKNQPTESNPKIKAK